MEFSVRECCAQVLFRPRKVLPDRSRSNSELNRYFVQFEILPIVEENDRSLSRREPVQSVSYMQILFGRIRRRPLGRALERIDPFPRRAPVPAPALPHSFVEYGPVQIRLWSLYACRSASRHSDKRVGHHVCSVCGSDN